MMRLQVSIYWALHSCTLWWLSIPLCLVTSSGRYLILLWLYLAVMAYGWYQQGSGIAERCGVEIYIWHVMAGLYSVK